MVGRNVKHSGEQQPSYVWSPCVRLNIGGDCDPGLTIRPAHGGFSSGGDHTLCSIIEGGYGDRCLGILKDMLSLQRRQVDEVAHCTATLDPILIGRANSLVIWLIGRRSSVSGAIDDLPDSPHWSVVSRARRELGSNRLDRLGAAALVRSVRRGSWRNYSAALTDRQSRSIDIPVISAAGIGYDPRTRPIPPLQTLPCLQQWTPFGRGRQHKRTSSQDEMPCGGACDKRRRHALRR